MTKNNIPLEWIQMLRGIAALLVVLTHARFILQNTPEWDLAQKTLLPGGLGVDLFFIISGFIMCYSTTNSDGSIKYMMNFAINRFSRIWPVYAAITIIWVLANGKGLNYFHSTDNLIALGKSLLFFPVAPEILPYFSIALPVGWTLVFEVYFYFIFAISLLFKRFRWIVLILWIFFTVVLIPLGSSIFSLNVMNNYNYSFDYLNVMTSPFLLEFLMGIIIGKLYLSKHMIIKNKYIAYHLLMLGVAFAIWCIYGFILHLHGPTQWGWPLALMVLIIAITSKTIDIKPPRFILWLGTISYSLYLTHLLSQFYLRKLLILFNLESQIYTWGYIFISTIIAITIAAISQYFLERKLSSFVRDLLQGKGRKAH